MKPNDIIRFNSPEEAIKAGYKPCGLCSPPTQSTPEGNKTDTDAKEQTNKVTMPTGN